jgi:hypothetical protein
MHYARVRAARYPLLKILDRTLIKGTLNLGYRIFEQY